MNKVIEEQIKRQVRRKINVRMIAPFNPKYSEKEFKKRDRKRLITRRVIKNMDFQLPSQIIMYGDKVAIISLKSSLLAMVIDNRDIANTLKTIFEFMWSSLE